MEHTGFKRSRAMPLLIAACTVFMFGCNRMADSDTNYLKAINKYYTDHPSCLFREPVKFPIEQNTSSPREIAGFDALVAQDLLTRSQGQQTVMVVASKPVNTYDLSAKGHSEWVADSAEPGYGNLCYGHRKAVAIQSSTPTTSSAGATTTVVYRYTMKDVPDWAKAQGVTTVFRDLQADLSGHQVGRASLQDTKKGWLVTTAPWAHIDDSDIYK